MAQTIGLEKDILVEDRLVSRIVKKISINQYKKNPCQIDRDPKTNINKKGAEV